MSGMDITEESSTLAKLQEIRPIQNKSKRSTFFGFFLSDDNKLVDLDREDEIDITDGQRKDAGDEVKSRSSINSEDETFVSTKKEASPGKPIAALIGLSLMLIQKLLMAIFYRTQTLNIGKKMEAISVVSLAFNAVFALLYILGIFICVKRGITAAKMLIGLLTFDNLVTSNFLLYPIFRVASSLRDLEDDEFDRRKGLMKSNIIFITCLTVFAVMNVCVVFALVRHIRSLEKTRSRKREEAVIAKIKAPK